MCINLALICHFVHKLVLHAYHTVRTQTTDIVYLHMYTHICSKISRHVRIHVCIHL
jgi:hypothetical protein